MEIDTKKMRDRWAASNFMECSWMMCDVNALCSELDRLRAKHEALTEQVRRTVAGHDYTKMEGLIGENARLTEELARLKEKAVVKVCATEEDETTCKNCGWSSIRCGAVDHDMDLDAAYPRSCAVWKAMK